MPAHRILNSIGTRPAKALGRASRRFITRPARVTAAQIRAARIRSLRVMRDIYVRATTPLALTPPPQPAGWPR